MNTAFSLYNLLFENELFSHNIIPLHDLYNKVLQHIYGQRASEAHPFILEEQNPLYLFVQLNVILLGSPILGTELIGRVRYLQKLRAVCAVVAFECLGRALTRTTLATSNLDRQSALVVQIALLLDQVVQIRGDLPASGLSCTRGKPFEEMRQHLIQYHSYYIQRLVPDVSGCHGVLFGSIRREEHRGYLGEPFWAVMSNLMPFIPLQMPSRLRNYTDMAWSGCGSESGEALYEHFTSHCSISCK